MAVDDAGEVVVEQDEVRGLLGDVGAVQPHGDADVGLLQRRRVVDPVAGDGDDLALLLQRFDEVHLLLGGDAGEEDLRGIQRQLQLRGRQAPQVVAGDDHRLIGLQQADLAGNGLCRLWMVAGDHDHADAGRGAARDGLGHLRPWRIFQPDQARENQATLLVGHAAVCRGVLDPTVGEGQHAQAGLGHFVLRGKHTRPGASIERGGARAELHEIADVEHRFQRALAVEPAALRRAADDRHALAIGVEGDFLEPREAFERTRRLSPHCGQCDFHGVAQPLAAAVVVHFFRVVAERGIHEERAVNHGQVRPRRDVLRRDELAAHPQAPHRHAILGQRTCLVGQDDRGRAERLHRGQVPHQRVALRHALRRHGQRKRHRRQQAFRHVGDDDADGEEQVFPERQAQRLADEEERATNAGGEKGNDAGQPGDLALQRRGGFSRRLGQVGDLAELGAHAGGSYHGACLARHHRGAGQHDVPGQERRHLRLGLGTAGPGQRFAGDRRGVDAHAERFDQPAVGRHEVALFEQHDVAGHQFGGECLRDLAGPEHLRQLRQQLAQRGDGPFGPVLLPEGKDPVDEDDADDGDPQPPHALAGVEELGKERQCGAQPQDDGEEMGELAGEPQQQGLSPHFLDVVRAELRQAAPCLGRRQARGRCVKAGERLLGSEALDVHGGMDGKVSSAACERSSSAGSCRASLRCAWARLA